MTPDAILSRKQREIADRERRIVEIARRELVTRGYLGLSMDRIADAIEYSKGTVYQHFSCKEDLVAEVTIGTMGMRGSFFARAAAFDGRPRERITAVGYADQVFADQCAEHFAAEQIVDLDSIRDKITPERLERLHQAKDRMMDPLLGIVTDAITAGDLTLPEGAPNCLPLYGLWTMSLGHRRITGCGKVGHHFANANLDAALWHNYQVLLDGYDWRPLSTEWEYAATIERVRTEVFHDVATD